MNIGNKRMNMIFKIVIFLFIMCNTSIVNANGGNNTIESFDKSKNILRSIYAHWQQQDLNNHNTIYCDCKFDKNIVNHKSCGYIPKNSKNKRSYKIEWEHVVPASSFGQKFDEWKNKGKYKQCAKLSGRQCAGKLNATYRKMEADMYNLYPAIGEVNAIRSNYTMGEISDKYKLPLGDCYFLTNGHKVKPRKDVRGDIARVYMYMNSAYPGFGIIKNDEIDMFERWSKEDPITSEEKERAEAIYAIQKNCNQYILNCTN